MTICPTRDCFSTKAGIKVREKMGKQMRKKISPNLERVQELGTCSKGSSNPSVSYILATYKRPSIGRENSFLEEAE